MVKIPAATKEDGWAAGILRSPFRHRGRRVRRATAADATHLKLAVGASRRSYRLVAQGKGRAGPESESAGPEA
jgi:hypothetical protein